MLVEAARLGTQNSASETHLSVRRPRPTSRQNRTSQTIRLPRQRRTVRADVLVAGQFPGTRENTGKFARKGSPLTDLEAVSPLC
jgi:hypothetical protein